MGVKASLEVTTPSEMAKLNDVVPQFKSTHMNFYVPKSPEVTKNEPFGVRLFETATKTTKFLSRNEILLRKYELLQERSRIIDEEWKELDNLEQALAKINTSLKIDDEMNLTTQQLQPQDVAISRVTCGTASEQTKNFAES